MLVLALLFHSPFPARENLQWAVAAGLFGGFALAVFYRALSQGNMGLTAPISAVLGAGIPTVFGFFTQGFPGACPSPASCWRASGIWLISRSEGVVGRPKGIGTALLAGVGFAGYFLCIHQAGEALGTLAGRNVALRLAAHDRRDRAGHSAIRPDGFAREWHGDSRPACSTSAAARCSSSPANEDVSMPQLLSARCIPRSRCCWRAFFCRNIFRAGESWA